MINKYYLPYLLFDEMFIFSNYSNGLYKFLGKSAFCKFSTGKNVSYIKLSDKIEYTNLIGYYKYHSQIESKNKHYSFFKHREGLLGFIEFDKPTIIASDINLRFRKKIIVEYVLDTNNFDGYPINSTILDFDNISNANSLFNKLRREHKLNQILND